jgi:cyanophycin synthetase
MTISIETMRCIEGPNIWSRQPVTEFLIELDSPTDCQPDEVRTLADRLTDLLPLFDDPSAEVAPLEFVLIPGEQGLAAMLGPLALNLQRAVGNPVDFSAARPTAVGRTHEIVVQHWDEVVGAAASRLAVFLLNHVRSGGEPGLAPVQGWMARFGTLAASRRYGTAAQTIVAAARQRGIPVSRIDPSGRIVELGNGAYRRRIHDSLTSLTSAIADSIVGNKYLTNHYLRAAGLPVPEGSVARTVEQAVVAARAIGYPVVVKPVDLGGSVGVFVDLRDEDEVRNAFAPAAAASVSGRVLVEKYVAGNEYRALIVNDQVVAVSHRVPAHVVGDGQHTIRRLIEVANVDPRRGKFDSDPLKEIVVDAMTMELLERQHLDLEAVPATGQCVRLKPTGKIPHGGFSIDRTDDVHPDNAAILRQAARVVGLDIASMDLVAHDIAESMWTTSGAIIEINTRSGFRIELHPGEGKSRDAGPGIVDMLFPPDRPVRAPIVAVTGDPRTSTVISRLIARFTTEAGSAVGLVSRDGLVIAGTRIRAVDALDPSGVRTLLNNPATEVVVAEVDPQQIMDQWLGFDYCDVAVVTSLSGLTTPFGKPIETVLTDLIGSNGVLVVNADDPGAASLARDRGESLVVFGLDTDGAQIRDHVDHGGRAVVLRQALSGDDISLIAGVSATDIFSAPMHPAAVDLPYPLSSHAMLAAVAAAIAREIPIEAIRRSVS